MSRRIYIVMGLVVFVLLLLLSWPWSGKFLLFQSFGRLKAAKVGVASPVDPSVADPVRFAKMEASFRKPISFYGRVVDQFGAAVPQADIKFYALDTPVGNGSQYDRKSDREGCFSITGIRGLTLGVAVSKPGYYQLKRVDGKVTSHGQFGGGISSSESAPILFFLQKQGILETLSKGGPEGYPIAQGGIPAEISVDASGSHTVLVFCWSKELEKRDPKQSEYDWHLEISPKSGGVLERSDALTFVAPESGYQSTTVIDMHPGSNDWSSLVARSYFLKFDDNTFARADIRMHASGEQFLEWTSFLNPKAGSRNLDAGSGK